MMELLTVIRNNVTHPTIAPTDKEPPIADTAAEYAVRHVTQALTTPILTKTLRLDYSFII